MLTLNHFWVRAWIGSLICALKTLWNQWGLYQQRVWPSSPVIRWSPIIRIVQMKSCSLCCLPGKNRWSSVSPNDFVSAAVHDLKERQRAFLWDARVPHHKHTVWAHLKNDQVPILKGIFLTISPRKSYFHWNRKARGFIEKLCVFKPMAYNNFRIYFKVTPHEKRRHNSTASIIISQALQYLVCLLSLQLLESAFTYYSQVIFYYFKGSKR